MSNIKYIKCCICEQDILPNAIHESLGWYEGHNAEPVKEGRCCDGCNDMFVIPARIMQLNLDRAITPN